MNKFLLIQKEKKVRYSSKRSKPKKIDTNSTKEKLFLVEVNTSEGIRSTSKIKSGCAAHNNCIHVVWIHVQLNEKNDDSFFGDKISCVNVHSMWTNEILVVSSSRYCAAIFAVVVLVFRFSNSFKRMNMNHMYIPHNLLFFSLLFYFHFTVFFVGSIFICLVPMTSVAVDIALSFHSLNFRLYYKIKIYPCMAYERSHSYVYTIK